MDLSIIIVNWNSKEYLSKCIGSIMAGTQGLVYEIIVIDSASFDGCAEMLREGFPQVKFIQGTENLGFAKANNLAYQSATGKCVFFLNPDTEIVGSAINILYSALNRMPNAGAVGGKLLNSNGTIQTSCIQAFPTILNQLLSVEALRRLTPKARLWGIHALFDTGGKPLAVEMISGACLMMYRAVFEEIGQFSSHYFMYAEDVDLCYKCIKHGFINYYYGEAVFIHHGGGSSQQASSNFSSVMMMESVLQFLNKWRGGCYSFCYRLALTWAALVRVTLLVVLSPVLLCSSGVSRWRASCSKWLAIFNWGLGLSRLPKQYLKN
jgi:GT2 family glycosyltransferase